MAWPNTPLTTYVGSSVPAIKAADLNSFQSAINGIINGTYSLAGVVLDGVGGAVVSPLAGGISGLSASAGGTSAPTPTFVRGNIYKESTLFAAANVTPGSPPTFNSGFNIASLTRNGTGQYTLGFNVVPSSIARALVTASCPGGVFCSPAVVSVPPLVITVAITNAAGTFVDPFSFCVQVFHL